MNNFSKHINWYPNNVLSSLKEETITVDEVTPPETIPPDTPAQEVPNYPVNVSDGDELAVSEIVDNNDKLVEEGEIDG